MAVRRSRLLPFVLFGLCCACCPRVGGAQGRWASAADPSLASGDEHEHESELEGEPDKAPRARELAVFDVPLPSGRDIAALTPNDCMSLLDRAAVQFEPVPDDAAPSVSAPVYVLAPLYGVSFGPKNGSSEHGMLDCRLALALYAWAPVLRDAGIVKVEHYSTYRPGARVRGRGKSSGHARALAIDAARFHLEDGRVLDVDIDWDDRERGGPPCPARSNESEESQLMRRVVCDAVERDLFQVVLTPHYDKAHQNHVHLELVPDVDWSYVR